MIQFTQNTERLIELLKEHYESDAEGMKTLVAIQSTPKIVRQYEVLRENPIVMKIRDEIFPKLTEAYQKLTGPKAHELDKMERAMHLCTIAWGEWFLMALGDKPEQRIDSVQKHIERLAERAGVVSKE